MADKAQLGEAQVAIRATLEQLDKDLGNAKARVGQVMGGVASTLGNIGLAGFGAFGAAATTAVGAVAGVGIALGGMAKQAVQIEGLRNAFDTLSKQAGRTGEDMLAALEKGSGGTVAATDLMTSFNKAASLVSLEFATGLPDAMELVSKAAAATGQDMGFLMDSLVTGVGRVSPMILDNLGIQVSLTDAVEAYAAETGKAASELTKQEQQEAVRLLTMQKLEEKYGEMESVYDTSAAKMQQMQAAFQDAKDQMGMAFMPVLTTVMEALTGLSDKLLPVIVPLVEDFANGILQVLGALEPLIPIIMDFSEHLGYALELFMGGWEVGAIYNFGEAVKEMVAGISELLPGMVTFGMDIIFAMVEGIIGAIPSLIEAGLQIMLSLAETLTTLLPKIMVMGIDILLTLVEGIASTLPELIPMAVNIIITLVMALIDKLPQIIETGIDVLFALIDGILAALPDLIAAVPEIITTLIDVLVENFPKVITAGGELLIAIVTGIIENLPELIAAGADIYKAIDEGLAQIYNSLIESGKGIIDGLWEGIKGAWGTFKEKVENLFPDLPKWVKDLLGIGSPSKVFAEIGKTLPQGLALGIRADFDEPMKEMERLTANLIPDIGLPQGAQINNTYNLAANYKYQDELTLTDHIRILNLLGSVA